MEHDYEESETFSEDIINCESDEEGADEYDEDNRIQAAGTTYVNPMLFLLYVTSLYNLFDPLMYM